MSTQQEMDSWIQSVIGVNPAKYSAPEPPTNELQQGLEQQALEKRLSEPKSYPGREQDEARLEELKGRGRAPPAKPSGGAAEPIGPVVVIKKPIEIHADKQESDNMDRGAAAVRTRAIVYVNDAYEKMSETVSDWVEGQGDKILQRQEPSSDRGLLAALASGVAGIAGAAFPEIAIAMAAVAAAAGTVGAVPDSPGDAKTRATVAMHGLAKAVREKTRAAKDGDQRKLDAALKEFDKGEGSYSGDPDVLERLAKGGDSDLDWIITKRLGFRLGKDVDPAIFEKITAALNAAMKAWIKADKKSQASLKEFGRLGPGYSEDGGAQWSRDYDAEHADDKDTDE